MIIPRTPNEFSSDRAIVDALLAESAPFQAPEATEASDTDADTGSDAELRNVLLAIRSLAHLSAPTPSTEVAAHFVEKVAENSVVSLSAHRHRRRKFTAVIGLSVAATIGLGVGTAAAASPDFRASVAQTFTTIATTIVSTVTGNSPPSGNNSDEPTSPAPSAPASTAPTDLQPLIPDPTELITPGNSPTWPQIPGEQGAGTRADQGNNLFRTNGPPSDSPSLESPITPYENSSENSGTSVDGESTTGH